MPIFINQEANCKSALEIHNALAITGGDSNMVVEVFDFYQDVIVDTVKQYEHALNYFSFIVQCVKAAFHQCSFTVYA